METSKILDIAKMSCGMNRADQIRATGRGWNRYKVIESRKRKRLEDLKRKELKEYEIDREV